MGNSVPPEGADLCLQKVDYPDDPDLKAQYDVVKRVDLEVKVLYYELQEHYPEVSVFVNWDTFDPIHYPFLKQRSLANDGLVVCAAYQRAQRHRDRLMRLILPPRSDF